MNSSKRGPAYGFKLASLEIVMFFPFLLSSTIVFLFQLSDTRTHDKRLTLLHFIVQTVQERFPDISNFDHELKSTERAAQGKSIDYPNDFKNSHLVSLENIQIDVQDLTRGLDNAKKELVIRQTMMVMLVFFPID